MHDVDEDLRTVYHQGGDWTHIFKAGITERFISTDNSFVNEYVASKNNIQPPILLGGYVMYYFTTSPC